MNREVTKRSNGHEWCGQDQSGGMWVTWYCFRCGWHTDDVREVTGETSRLQCSPAPVVS